VSWVSVVEDMVLSSTSYLGTNTNLADCWQQADGGSFHRDTAQEMETETLHLGTTRANECSTGMQYVVRNRIIKSKSFKISLFLFEANTRK